MSARDPRPVRLQELHEELADLYSEYPYITLKNSHTEGLWVEIERLEADL